MPRATEARGGGGGGYPITGSVFDALSVVVTAVCVGAGLGYAVGRHGQAVEVHCGCAGGGGGGLACRFWCLVLVCSRRPLADRHSLPLPSDPVLAQAVVPIGLPPPRVPPLPPWPTFTSPLPFPLVGGTNGAPRLSRFHFSVSGPRGGGQTPFAVAPVRPSGRPEPAVRPPTAAFGVCGGGGEGLGGPGHNGLHAARPHPTQGPARMASRG